ncbi:MAG: hypothetical protein AB7S38_30610 [Vulcanimicrobiota bacterium]
MGCRAKRGATLATALVVGSLAFLAAFILAGSSFAELGYAQRIGNERRALNLAESATQMAAARLLQNDSYGQAGEQFELELAGAWGGLTFVVGETPYSTYNLDSETAVQGFGGRVVPPHSIHLVGYARCANVVRRSEMVITRPPFPFVVAASGPIISQDGLVVGTLDDSGNLEAGPDELLPGHLASNSSELSAIELRGSGFVAGNLRSVGGITLDPTIEVRGQQLTARDPVELPRIALSDFDPARTGDPYQDLPREMVGQTLVGVHRGLGDLTVVGDLNLSGATLFVDGDLTVYGGVTGKGLVVVTGQVKLGGAELSSQNQSVFLAGSDVTLNGSSQQQSSFQGLVYTEGNFSASDIRVVGAFVANGPDSKTVLERASLVAQPDYTRLDLEEVLAEQDFAFGFRDAGAGMPDLLYQTGTGPALTDTFIVKVRLIESHGRRLLQVTNPFTGAILEGDESQAGQLLAAAANEAGQLVAPSDFKVWDPNQTVGRQERAYGDQLDEMLSSARPPAQLSPRLGHFDLNEFLGRDAQWSVLVWRSI